ncbi:MAG: hypothetical protein OER88_02645, partial [Planctomycetota bacterium]|nr:hypothetical protein [Planctomycetota bacterium]
DARVVARVPRDLKKRVQEAAYVWTILREARGWRSPGLRVSIDGVPHPREVLAVLIGRGPHYGGAFRVFPGATPEDPRLDAVLIEGTRLVHALPFVFGAFVGRADRASRVVRVQAGRLEIESDAPCEVELDGDAYGETPVRFAVEPIPRRVLAPPQSTIDATER